MFPTSRRFSAHARDLLPYNRSQTGLVEVDVGVVLLLHSLIVSIDSLGERVNER